MIDHAGDLRRIRELLRKIEVAENRADVAALLSVLADDVVFMAPDEAVREGKAACTEFIEGVFADRRAHFRREIEYTSADLEVHESIALDRGGFTFTVVPHSGGESSGGSGKYLFVYSRGPDQVWKLARAIVNLDGEAEPANPAHLALTALLVREYDAAIEFFVKVLGFELVEDSPSLTNDGRPKRWVVVRPAGAETGVLLARADGAAQQAIIGNQFAGRVGMFLRVDDFEAMLGRLGEAGVRIVSGPRDEPYGRVAVFLDLEGNRWDLVGPGSRTTSVA